MADLINLVRNNVTGIMLNTVALGEYQQNFQRVSSYLIAARHISEFDQKHFFREGIHPILNQELDHSLRFVQYDYPIGIPWDVPIVINELQRILSGSHIGLRQFQPAASQLSSLSSGTMNTGNGDNGPGLSAYNYGVLGQVPWNSRSELKEE